MTVFTGSPHELAYVYLDLIGTITSSIASIITILVINKMKITGYIKLILTMTWFQFIYDVSFFNGTIDVGNYWVTYVANVWQIVGGIGSSLISNWIAFVVLYVVCNKRSIDIMRNYKYMLASAVIPAFGIATLYSVGAVPRDKDQSIEDLANLGFYYYTRLVSIMLNFLMFGMASYFNHLIRSKGLGKSPAEQAINTLCRRLMYYPLLQAISRSGFAWYEFQYGYDFNVSNCTGDSGCYTALIYATLITPTVSFGYLALFLKIEPHAYDRFRNLFGFRSLDRTESKDTSAFGGRVNSTTGSVNGGAFGSGASTVKTLSVESPSDTTSDKLGAHTVHTEDTVSTNAYIQRESSLYIQQQQSSFAFAGSSLWNTDVEEADDRDEEALLSSINSEQLPAPPSFSFKRSIGGSSIGNAAAATQDIEEPAARGSFLKSAMRPMFSGKRKSVTLDLTLQSSTTSPIIPMSGVRIVGEERDSFVNSSL